MKDILYHDKLLFHYHHPAHYGLRDGFDVEGEASNPLCGDSMIVRLKFRGGVVQDVCFESKGCVISRVAGSLVAAYIIGKDRATIWAMGAADAVKLLEAPLTPARITCATVFLDSVKKAG